MEAWQHVELTVTNRLRALPENLGIYLTTKFELRRKLVLTKGQICLARKRLKDRRQVLMALYEVLKVYKINAKEGVPVRSIFFGIYRFVYKILVWIPEYEM